MLELPPTVRLPRPDEIPNSPEAHSRLKDREKANIVEGYVLHYNTSHDLPFKFFVEMNIDNSKLWSLFHALVNELPKNLSFIYNLYEEEAVYSEYKGQNFNTKSA